MDSHEIIYLIDRNAVAGDLYASVLSLSGYSVQRFASSGAFIDEVSIAETGCVICSSLTSGNSCVDILKELVWRGSDLTVICIPLPGAAPINVRVSRSSTIVVLKHPFSTEELLSVVKNGVVKSHQRRESRRRLEDVERRLAQLTESETDVLRCLMKGLSHKNISAQLEISSRSVDRRRRSVLEKMGVETLQQLIGMLAELRFDT